MTFLGAITAQPCPRCHRPMRLVGQVRVCPDQIHCRAATPRMTSSRDFYVQVMRRGVAA